MATPAELAQERTALNGAQQIHVQRLLATWAVLADLSFSDLVLLAPIVSDASEEMPTVAGPSVLTPTTAPTPSLFSDPSLSSDPSLFSAPPSGLAPSFVMLGQVRPNNTPTVIPEDLVGQTLLSSDWPVITDAMRMECVMTGTVELQPDEDPVRLRCIPVRHQGKVVAVVAQLSAEDAGRRPGRLERVYEDLFDRLCIMVTEGTFPFSGEDSAAEEAPRVGDGIIVVDQEGRVTYTSPNASNALHRMGVYSQVEGRRLGDLGVEETAVTWALALARPVVEEVERRPDVVVLLQVTPLSTAGEVTGAMILLRDVTDLRRLDRLLLSKDAAIREVHHRVKNNLQTISSLLRLQARRLDPGEGQVALREAERRVRSIAMVHEVLSREPGDQVPFDEIVASLVQMAQDSVVSSRPVEFSVVGSIGEIAADVATSLAIVLAELLQNAVEHAFGEGPDAEDPAAAEGHLAATGHIVLRMTDGDGTLDLQVEDDGCGIPEGFDIEQTESLGLSIVRDLVTSQLDGKIAMRLVDPDRERGSGTVVELTIPVK